MNFWEIEPHRPKGPGCQCDPFFDDCNVGHYYQWFICPVHGEVRMRWVDAVQLTVREVRP